MIEDRALIPIENQSLLIQDEEPETMPVLTMIIRSPEKQQLFYAPADTLFFIAHNFISSVLNGGMNGENEENKRLAQLIRVGVKGILMMYGDKILNAMIGIDHPKPQKGDDLIAWYTNIFAQISIIKASKDTLIIFTQPEEDGRATEIYQIASEPLSNNQI